MTDEQIVRARYPNAEAERSPAVYQQGQIAPYQPESWRIVRIPPSLGQAPLGEGATAEQAWSNAATKIEEEFLRDSAWKEQTGGTRQRDQMEPVPFVTFRIIPTDPYYQTIADWPGEWRDSAEGIQTLDAAKQRLWQDYKQVIQKKAALQDAQREADME